MFVGKAKSLTKCSAFLFFDPRVKKRNEKKRKEKKRKEKKRKE